MSNTTRIAKNTIFLYFRQILIMLVSLYTVCVVLNVLGAEDYGIYNVVAGVVTMFSFLSGAMASASQRYFSFDFGKGDSEHLKITFSVTLSIYILLIFIVVILAETVGLWFVNNKLVIPQERMNAAKWIYQFAVLNFVVTMIMTPYMASIIAHENMDIYAYVSIIEAALKLAVVFILKILPYDKLIVYGILLIIDDLNIIRTIDEVPGFIQFLPQQDDIQILYGRDLELVNSLEQGGEFHGFLKVRFDEKDKVVILNREFQGIQGAVTKVDRRTQKLRLEVQLENGIKVLNLSFYDVEKQDWSMEEKKYMEKVNLHKIA